jgi:hypothetical protein
MEIFPIQMALLLLRAFCSGAATAVVYGAFLSIRILLGDGALGGEHTQVSRRKLPLFNRSVTLCDHPWARAAVTFAGDLLCILCIAVWVTVLNYAYNYGEFRSFPFIGAIIGFFACRFSVIKLAERIVRRYAVGVKYILCSIFAVLWWPFYKIGGFFAKRVRKLIFLYSFTLEKRSKKVYNVTEKVYLLKMAVKKTANKGKNDGESLK